MNEYYTWLFGNRTYTYTYTYTTQYTYERSALLFMCEQIGPPNEKKKTSTSTPQTTNCFKTRGALLPRIACNIHSGHLAPRISTVEDEDPTMPGEFLQRSGPNGDDDDKRRRWSFGLRCVRRNVAGKRVELTWIKVTVLDCRHRRRR